MPQDYIKLVLWQIVEQRKSRKVKGGHICIALQNKSLPIVATSGSLENDCIW